MTPNSRAFLDAISLTESTPLRGQATFTAVTQYAPWPKAYGGDLVAQSAASAIQTAGGRPVHSMHSYFLRPAAVGREVQYQVETLRDGRSYSSREVRAYQDGLLLSIALVSFHDGEGGHTFAETMPDGVPAPETLLSSAQHVTDIEGPAAEYWSSGRSFDLRHVTAPLYSSAARERESHQLVWIKAFERLPDDPSTHRLALAYVCDYTILESLLRQQGRAWADPGLVTASLDHSLWFHREGRLDDWVLYVQSAASAQGGRGLARGAFFSRSGSLLASVAQEGMIRDRSA